MMPDISAIHVDPGFTWTSLFTGLSGGSLLGIFYLIIKQVGPWRKQRDDAEQNLRTALTKRVDKLEQTLELERARHEAERSLERHKIRNLTQCLDAVLFVLEKAPDKTAEVVAEIRAMRQKQIEEEMREASTIRAAEIAAKTKEDSDASD